MILTPLPGCGVPSRADWFGASGYSADVDTLRGPRDYARHLISYLRDDSTVRARVADRHAIRLPLAEIAAMRAEIDAVRERRAQSLSVAEPMLSDEFDFRVSDRPFHWQNEAHCAKAQDQARREEEKRRAAAAFARTSRHICTPSLLAAIGGLVGVSPADICGEGRTVRVMRGRCLAYAVLRARGNSWPQVAAMLGGRSHASAIHGARQFFDRWIREPDLLKAWRSLAPCVVGSALTYEEFAKMVVEVRR